MAALAGDAVEIVVFLGTGSPLFTFRAPAKDEEAAEFGVEGIEVSGSGMALDRVVPCSGRGFSVDGGEKVVVGFGLLFRLTFRRS